MQTATWYRCPNCGHASPDCFDEENAETLAWTPDQAPGEAGSDRPATVCPHCGHTYDVLSAEPLQDAGDAPPRRDTAG